MKYRFVKENIKKYIKEINQEKIYQITWWYSRVIEKKDGFDTGEGVGGSRHSLAR